MPLAKRIIPCLDVARGRVVKGIHFRDLRDAGDPVELAKRYCEEGADELIFLDIEASPQGRGSRVELVRRVAESVNIPFTVGGGIRSLEDARALLLAGADKVSINTAAVQEPRLISWLAERFGQQCVVVAIDAKRRYEGLEGRRVVKCGDRECWYEVFIKGARVATGLDALAWGERVEELGAGEILLTSIDADGTQEGYDVSLTKAMSRSTNLPIIASGGCGNLEHIYEVLTEGEADAALAASIFHYQRYTIAQVKEHLKGRGICVRD